MSEWTQGGSAAWPVNASTEVEVTAQPELQLTEEQKDDLIRLWMVAKLNASKLVEAEQVRRADLTKVLFPTPKKGTQRYLSPQGYGSIKLVYGWNYSLGDKDKIDPSSGLKLPIQDQVDAVLDQIEALGDVAKLLATRLVKWKPELSVSEYEALAAAQDPLLIQVKNLIDSILTVTPASPQLTFEPPKAAK